MLPVRIEADLKKLGLDVQSNSLALHAGFSGASVYRIDGYAIKRHLASSYSHLQRVHVAQQAWAVSLSGWVPRLVCWPSSMGHVSPTILMDQGACWECMEWLHGEPIGAIDLVTPEHLRNVANALGVFHRVARNWEVSRAFADRIDQRMVQRRDLLERVVQSQFRSQCERLDSWASRSGHSASLLAFSGAIDRALRVARYTAPGYVQWIQELSRNATLKQWGHGDAWRGNWLFDRDAVCGLIDFSQADVRWPGFDFARVIGSMARWRSAGWQEAWACYVESLGEPGFTLGDCQLMHRVSMILTLVWYLDRLEMLNLEDPRVMDRIKEVCGQLID